MLAAVLLIQLIIRTLVCQAPCTIGYHINIDDSVRGELCLVLMSDDGQSQISCFPAELEGRVKWGQWKDLPGGTYYAQVVTRTSLKSNMVQMTIVPQR